MNDFSVMINKTRGQEVMDEKLSFGMIFEVLFKGKDLNE